MKHSFTDEFIKHNEAFVSETLMGPSAMRIAEELAAFLPLDGAERILDLGCGAGLSSIYLAKAFSAVVFAADLWISPTDNHKRFGQLGLGQRIIPLMADATKGLPFAQEYFDVLLSVDAYHYFGTTPDMLPSLIPYVKKGGYIAIAVPGWKEGLTNGLPTELEPFFTQEDAKTIQTLDWWKQLWSGEDGVELTACREMDCCAQAWDEWITSPNPYAAEDAKMMAAGGGKYLNMVQLIARRK